MASRVIEAGTIVTRVQQLLSCGLLKERPLWLDVVERFPPIIPPKHNRLPERGRPLTLHYQRDRLTKDFKENYEVVTSRGEPYHYNSRTVISLFEGRPSGSCSTAEQQPPSLVERIVEEQMRLMAEGESKEDAMAAAINQVSTEDKSIIIQPKSGPPTMEEKEQETSQLEKAVLEMHNILNSK